MLTPSIWQTNISHSFMTPPDFVLLSTPPGFGSPTSWEEGRQCHCLLEWLARSTAEKVMTERSFHLGGIQRYKVEARVGKFMDLYHLSVIYTFVQLSIVSS